MQRRELGNIGEELALVHLRDEGFSIVARNLRLGHDEIDIVAENDIFIILVEVKTRRLIPGSADSFGRPYDEVRDLKRNNLLRSGEAYIQKFKPSKFIRLDIIEVFLIEDSDSFRLHEIKHYENAVNKNHRNGNSVRR